MASRLGEIVDGGASDHVLLSVLCIGSASFCGDVNCAPSMLNSNRYGCPKVTEFGDMSTRESASFREGGRERSCWF